MHKRSNLRPDNVTKPCKCFFKLILNILWKFHVVQNWIHKLRTLAVGDFSNYNHFIKFNFLLMNNISISTEMYIEPWVNAVKLDVQCDHHLLLPLFLINFLSHWSIELLPNFLSVYPMHLILLLKALRCLYIALCSCKASCPKLHNQVDWGHKNYEVNFPNSDIIRDISLR